MSLFGIHKGTALATLLLSTQALAQTVTFESATSQLQEQDRDSLIVKVNLSEAPSKSINIPIILSGSAERNRDYSINNRSSIRFSRGKTTAEFKIRARNDRDVEGEESFNIELLPVDNISVGEIGSHTVVIQDDELSIPGNPDSGEPKLSFATPNQNVEEMGQDIPIVIKLSKVAERDVRFNLVATGSAEERDDYKIDDDSLTIKQGESEVSTFITIQDDGVTEGLESIQISFDRVKYAEIGEANALNINIEENDPDVAWNTECGDNSAGRMSYSYCITKTEGSKSEDILFYFHGAYGSEKDWTNGTDAAASYKKAVRWAWQQSGHDAPTVVAVSLGSLWMLNLHGAGGADFDAMANDVIPQIERQALGHELRGRRLLMGISMGGFNSTQLLFRRSDLWDKAVIVAPLMPLCYPFQPEEALYMCVLQDEYESNAFLGVKAHQMVQDFFDPIQWDEANPLNLGKATLNSDSTELLLTSGTHDGFAFYTKNKELGEYGQKVAPVTWISTAGEHGYFDTEIVADYLAK